MIERKITKPLAMDSGAYGIEIEGAQLTITNLISLAVHQSSASQGLCEDCELLRFGLG